MSLLQISRRYAKTGRIHTKTERINQDTKNYNYAAEAQDMEEAHGLLFFWTSGVGVKMRKTLQSQTVTIDEAYRSIEKRLRTYFYPKTNKSIISRAKTIVPVESRSPNVDKN